MRAIGFRSLTYRLRTELGIEAWHWNPDGRWSESARQSGYWTSNSSAKSAPISVGWGYRLPRRGSTVDQANNDGYSRLDDGDTETFWKSNPYLDQRFTREPNAQHPQWIVIDLKKSRAVNAIRLQWGVPFATRYRVDYCALPPTQGAQAANFDPTFEPGARWIPFPKGSVANGSGGDITLQLSPRLIDTRFIRVLMMESSHTAPAESKDVRDSLGYALRETYLGRMDQKGKFVDYLRHGKSAAAQSPILVSSTDPWHRSSDRDSRTEQPGFDKVINSGVTNGLPVLTPVAILYDTPENAVAELKYLRARDIPVNQVELGEEPDGQNVSPEDYGALYLQFADALHAVDPSLKLGGPSFQTAIEGWIHWPNVHGETSWMRRFIRYLKARGRLSDFAFFSFEWYPFDDLAAPASLQVPRNSHLLVATLDRLVGEGLPRSIPWIISEYGYSSFATRDEVTLPAALVNAEIAAEFLTLGGDSAYLYGYEPGELNREAGIPGASWGNVISLLSDERGIVRARLPTWWTGWLLAHEWSDDAASDKPHALYTASVCDSEGKPDVNVAAFPLSRPDRTWSLLLLNKSATDSRSVAIPLTGKLEIWRYGSEQYAWKDDGPHGFPLRNLPPSHQMILDSGGNQPTVVKLPPFSLAVVQGRYR